MNVISLIERMSQAFGIAGAVLVAPLIGALIYEVASRYVFGAPTFWAFELSYMLMGSIFVLSISCALRDRLHVNVDFLHSILPPRVRAAIDLFGYLVLMFAVYWISTALLETALEAFHSNEVSGVSAWNPVIWPFKTIWFLGFAMLCLQVFAESLKATISLWTSKKWERQE